MKDLIGAANMAFVKSRLDSGLTQRAWEDCKSRFQIFHVLNYIMYTEALKGFDKLEETGALRFAVKRGYNVCEKVWGAYQRTMRRSMDDDTWVLMQDYVTGCWNDIDGKIRILEISCHNYMLKLRHKNAEVLSYLVSAQRVHNVIVRLWGKYFKTYERICGLDFSRSFLYADMTTYGAALKKVIDELSKTNPSLNFADDKYCRDALTILEMRLGDEDFLNDAARRAIRFNPRFMEEYKGELDDITRTEETRQSAADVDNFTRLSSKFKVVRAKSKGKTCNIKNQ